MEQKRIKVYCYKLLNSKLCASSPIEVYTLLKIKMSTRSIKGGVGRK